MKAIIFLTSEDVLRIYEKARSLFGGSYGIRDLALLESSVIQPKLIAAYLNNDVFQIAGFYTYPIFRPDACYHLSIHFTKLTKFLEAFCQNLFLY